MTIQPVKRFFRVQGGVFPNRSKNTIGFDKAGNINISCHNSVYIGDLDHVNYFLLKRLGAKSLNDLPDDIAHLDVNVIEMIVPNWLAILIEKYSISQFDSKSQPFPRIVDQKTPGKSYQISKHWAKLFEEACVEANKYQILEKRDIYKVLLSNENLQKNYQIKDYSKIKERVNKCNIKPVDISQIYKKLGLKFSINKKNNNEGEFLKWLNRFMMRKLLLWYVTTKHLIGMLQINIFGLWT